MTALVKLHYFITPKEIKLLRLKNEHNFGSSIEQHSDKLYNK